MATDTWFVMIPPGYAGKSTAEKELVDFVVQYPAGSANWAKANAGQIVGGGTGLFGQFFLGEGNQQLVKWLGPFATQAEAKTAANPQQQSPNPLNDATNAAENSSGNPLSFFQGLFTRGNAIRLAEGILGIALILVAVAELGKGTAVGNAVKKVPFI